MTMMMMTVVAAMVITPLRSGRLIPACCQIRPTGLRIGRGGERVRR
jgi:hypothetical protein